MRKMAERIIECAVPDGITPTRADKLFAAACGSVSRARLQQAFSEGQVTFEGQVIEQSRKIATPGILRAVLNDPDPEDGPSPTDIPLAIVHEDDALLVVDKPPGMVTHPGSGTGEDTLVHALLHHCGDRLSPVGAPDRPGIVHRLDKETSGLIVVAKTEQAHHHLAKAFGDGSTYKRYLALVSGVPGELSGTCRGAIARHPVHRTRMAVVPSGRTARTDWTMERSFGGRAALLSCILHSGRTHQIRVHLSALGHPVLGDTTYGFRPNRLPGIEAPRVLLHAAELRVPHPDGGMLELEAPLPEDMQAALNSLLTGCAG